MPLRIVMFTWMVIVWRRRLRFSTLIGYRLGRIICLLSCCRVGSPGRRWMRWRLIGIMRRISCIWRRRRWKKRLWRKRRGRLRRKIRLWLDKRNKSWLRCKGNSNKTNKHVRRASNRCRSRRSRCKRKSVSNKPSACESKFKTRRKPCKTPRTSKSKRSSKNITLRKNSSRPSQNAFNSTWSPKNSSATFPWAWKWCF